MHKIELPLSTMKNNMIKSIEKTNKEYSAWIKELKFRYLSQRIKASVAVNTSLLEFYWSLGKDINEKQFQNTYGSGFYKKLSDDMTREIPDTRGFSPRNLSYAYKFYKLYNGILQQDVAKLTLNTLFSVPWGHHQRIIDRCAQKPEIAIFYIKKTVQNNWGRDILLNFLDTDLYEREGHSVSNFKARLSEPQGELAQQLVKDPYNFDFLTMRQEYDEKELKDALISNIEKFLLELGTGFAYMGREYRLQVGKTEQFLDLLFYNTKLHGYVVVEVKVKSFEAAFLGQLGAYVSCVDHLLKAKNDSPTIGLLVCKDKDNFFAQYSLDAYKVPLGISEFNGIKFLPEAFKCSLPSIEALENELKHK